MAKLIREVKQINHKLTADELAELSQRNASLNIEIEDKKVEGKNVAAQYSNQVKVLEAKRQETSQKILSKSELRDVFCYARKNYNTSLIEYISMEGEIILEEPFRTNDYRKQFELKEELAQKKLQKIQYFGMRYFFDEFGKIDFEKDIMDSEVADELQKHRTKFISKCIQYLVEEKKILEVTDDVEFDAIYGIVDGWYDSYCSKYYEEPKEEDYKVEEEVEPVPETIEEKVEEKTKKSEGENEEPPQDEDLKNGIDDIFN